MFNIFGSNENNVDVQKFDELRNQGYTIIDIRTQEEYNQSRIEGAKLINFYDAGFKRNIESLDKEGKYIIYCRSGNRSGNAISIFKKAGIKEIYHLSGGIISWHREGKPLVR